MSGGSATQADVDIDLGRLIGAIWEKKIRLLLLTLFAAFVAYGLTSMVSPLYNAETRILIEAREPVYSSNQVQRPAEPVFDERAIASQVEVLRSNMLVQQVVRDLNLGARPEFDPAANPSAITDLMVVFGLAKNPLEIRAEERVLKEFYEKLDIYAVPTSRVIVIEFSSEDPALAASVPNALADAYLQAQSGVKLENNTDASAWLEPAIANLRAKVRESENKIAAYRSEKGLLMVGSNDTIATRQLSDITTELNRVTAERVDAEARVRAVRTAIDSGQALDTVADIQNSALIQRLRETEIAPDLLFYRA